jgi:hypothetical protein
VAGGEVVLGSGKTEGKCTSRSLRDDKTKKQVMAKANSRFQLDDNKKSKGAKPDRLEIGVEEILCLGCF